MPVLTANDPTRAASQNADATRLSVLLKRVETGDPVDPAELSALTRSPDRATAGLAKRLSAVLLLQNARRQATRLLFEACDDLDYRYPVVLNEAIAHAVELRDKNAVFSIRVHAAAAHARRGEHLAALTHLQNAAGEDFRLGAAHANNPESIAAMVNVYETVALAARQQLSIRPAPRRQRRSPANGKLRMGHVIAQLVDGNHSTSRAAHTFLKHADRDRFDVYLFVTEALAAHEQSAGQMFISEWSDERARKRIAYFEQTLGVPVVRPRTRTHWLAAAADLHAQMAERQIDIAFFHGSLATPNDWMLCAWQAAPWQFDRAFGGPLFCPAVDYQFFEFAATMEKLAFLCRERNIPYGPLRFGGADLSHVMEAQPIPREALNVPPDHLLVATIGNHLPTRMSESFCRTVAGVLRQHPAVTYLVIGPGDFSMQRAIFADLAGSTPRDGRIRFIGPSSVSERVAQTIDIYLNEYPSGGGVAVGEAMAASKPVVCIQAGDSSLAMAGAFYVGPDELVRPATDDAYAQRFSRLLTDPAERIRCGQALHRRYMDEFDGRKLTQDETERIWRVVHGLPPEG